MKIKYYLYLQCVLKQFAELKYCEENPKACLNGGKCTSLTKDEGSFKCECPSGFKGKNCEIVPIIANTTTPRPRPSSTTTTTTKLPSQVTASSEEDEDENDDTEHATEAKTESDAVAVASVEEIDNEA